MNPYFTAKHIEYRQDEIARAAERARLLAEGLREAGRNVVRLATHGTYRTGRQTCPAPRVRAA